MSEQKSFPRGIFYKNPHQNAPQFVIGNLSIKCEDFVPYLREVAEANEKGEHWVNLQIKISQKTNMPYLDLNNYKPKEHQAYEQKTVPLEHEQVQEALSQVPF